MICVTALGSSLISIISPNGNTKKVLNTVLSAFILCSLLIPIKNTISNCSIDYNLSYPKTELTSSANIAYEKAVLTETEIKLNNHILSILKQKKIEILKTKISLNKSAKTGIYIDNISVYISDDYKNKTPQIKKIIKENFKIEPNVIVRNNEKEI